jgi:hypothetical protein
LNPVILTLRQEYIAPLGNAVIDGRTNELWKRDIWSEYWIRERN